MDNANNRPARQAQTRNVDGMMASSSGKQSPNRQKRPLNKKLLMTVVSVLAVIALVAAVWLLVVRPSSTASAIDGNKYQAVFFTNGQVYFGKLQSLNGDYMRLTDIYYLQAKSDEDNEESNPQRASNQDSSNVQLVKLGSEIHGPDDEMILNKEQVLFFENLKNDSNVSTTIKSYQQSRSN